MMLIEKSHKSIRQLPAGGGTFSLGEWGPPGPGHYPRSFLPIRSMPRYEPKQGSRILFVNWPMAENTTASQQLKALGYGRDRPGFSKWIFGAESQHRSPLEPEPEPLTRLAGSVNNVE